MVKKEENTEEKILFAAKEVFIQKGMEGARMQEIADKAKINKSLLHYYFRTKEKLFEKIFRIAFSLFIPRIEKKFTEQLDIFEFIKAFVKNYLDTLQSNPFIPGFVLNELKRDSSNLVTIFTSILNERTALFSKLSQMINENVEKGIIRPIEPASLIVNMVALCIFPIISKPIVSGVFFDNDKDQFNNFMKNRKTEVADFIINSIKI